MIYNLTILLWISVLIQIPRSLPARINPIHRIIETIREHIAPDEPLSGACEAVGVEEAAGVGVVVAGLQVIEAGVRVVVVATVAQGDNSSKGFCAT